MKVLMILAIGGMVAAAAKALEDDVVFRILEEGDDATFEHEQFWVDRDSNQVEGRFTYATPEGRELETRYSAGLNGFTVEGDHLPVKVEDTPEVAEARAAFMAYMIELIAEQEAMKGKRLKNEEEPADYQEIDQDDDDFEVIEASSRKRRAPEARHGYYQQEEMESRMVEDLEDQLAMPTGAMSYSRILGQPVQPPIYWGAAKKSQMAVASSSYNPSWLGSSVSGSPVRAFGNYPTFSASDKYPTVSVKDQSSYPTGSVYPTDPYQFGTTKFTRVPETGYFYRTSVPTSMTKSTAKEKFPHHTMTAMPVKAPLDKYTVPASTYYQLQPKVYKAYMPTYENMAAKRPVIVRYHSQFQHPHQPASSTAMDRSNYGQPAKTPMFSATPTKKQQTYSKLPYYSVPAKTEVQAKAKTMENMFKNNMKQYSDYSIPMRPAEKQQQQQIFSYHQGFHQPQFMRQHAHYPMYPTNTALYNPSWLGSSVSGSPVRAFDNYPAFSASDKYPAVPVKDQSNYPTGSVPARPIPQVTGTAQGNHPARPMHPGVVGVGGNGVAGTLPGLVYPPGVMPPAPVPGVPARPIPDQPGNEVGGAHPHHPGHGPGSPGNGPPQVEEPQPGNSSPGFVPNTSDVDQPAAILF